MDLKVHLPTFEERFIKSMCNCPTVWDLYKKEEKILAGLIEFNDAGKGFACCFDEESYILDRCRYSTTRCISSNFIYSSRPVYGIDNTFHGIPTMESIKEYNDKCTEEKDKIKKVYFADGTILSV